MRSGTRSYRARLGALLLCAPALLSGCAWMPWRNHAQVGCPEKPFAGADISEPPLKAPEGLSAPDTRSAIKVPPLNESETSRPKSAPCLDQPPSYAVTTSTPSGGIGAAPQRAVPPATPPTAPAASSTAPASHP